MSERACNKCGGSGNLFHPDLSAPTSPCWQCGGSGYLPEITSWCVNCADKNKRIEELEAACASCYDAQQRASEEVMQLQAKLDAVKKLPSCEFHDRQYPYASLGKWVRVADIEYTLQQEQKS